MRSVVSLPGSVVRFFRLPALIAVVGPVLLVLVGMMLGWFVPLNGFLYDGAIRAFDRGTVDRVLVVEVPEASAPDWRKVGDELLQLGASVVAFDAGTASAGDGMVAGLLFGPNLARGAGNEGPAAASIMPPAQYGIHRTQDTSVEIGGARVPTLEAAAAGAEEEGSFYVRFPGGQDGVPRVGLADVVEGRLPRSLVEGRAVLLGRDEPDRGLATPVSPNAPHVSLLDFRAYALQTLLSGRVPRALPPGWAAGLVLVAASSGAALFRRTPPGTSVPIAAAVTVAILLAGVAALFLADTVLPVAELLTSQALVSLLIWRSNEAQQDQRLGGIARGSAPERSDTGDVRRSLEGPTAVLGLKGSLVYGLDSNGRARPTHGENLATSDLPPALRDGTDPAFARAASQARPVEVDPSEQGYYLAPLMQSGRLIGYWLLAGQAPGGLLDSLRSAIEAFAPAVAGTLVTSADRSSTEGKRVDEALQASLDELRVRVAAFETLLGEASTALELRDLLGRPVASSSRFRALAQGAGANPAGEDPVALIAAIAGITGEEAASILRFVAVERGPVSVPARKVTLADAVIRLSTLVGPVADGPGFLLIEIVDLHEAILAGAAQRVLIEQLDLVLRNDLGAMQLAAGLLEKGELEPGRRARAVGAMRTAVRRARERLLALDPFIRVDREAGVEQVSLVDLAAALTEVADEARRNGASINLDAPGIMPAVVAQPRLLRRLVAALLALLGGEGGASVYVLVGEENERVRVEFSAPDLGLSDRQLRTYLDGSREAESAEMRVVASVARELPNWGGAIEVSSGQSQSLRFLLTLRKLT